MLVVAVAVYRSLRSRPCLDPKCIYTLYRRPRASSQNFGGSLAWLVTNYLRLLAVITIMRGSRVSRDMVPSQVCQSVPLGYEIVPIEQQRDEQGRWKSEQREIHVLVRPIVAKQYHLQSEVSHEWSKFKNGHTCNTKKPLAKTVSIFCGRPNLLGRIA